MFIENDRLISYLIRKVENHFMKQKLRFFAVITIGCYFPLVAFAEELKIPREVEKSAIQQQLREQQQLEMLQKRPDIFLPEVKKEEIPEKEVLEVGPCFPIEKIELQDVPDGWRGWLEEAIPFSLPMCLNSHHINAITRRLGNRILQKGYLTSRIELPEQNLQKKILTLKVHPGYIGAIRDPEGKTSWALRSAFPGGRGDILNVRDLDQGLEQLMRPMTQQAKMVVTPGHFVGTSDIVVTRENQFPLSYGVSLDNGGREGTGKWQASAYLVWDRPLGLNDSLMIFYNQDSSRLSEPKSRGNSAYYTLPWGDWTWGLAISQYRYRQNPYGNKAVLYTGHTSNWEISLERMMHRTQRSKTEMKLHVAKKTSNNDLKVHKFAMVGERSLAVWGVDVTHRHHLGRSIIDLQLGMQNVRWWGAPPSFALPPQVIYNGKISAMVPFSMGQTHWRWQGQWYGQYSPDVLYPSEEISIGNRYTVRGFRADLSTDNGHYLRNDLVWSILPPNEKGKMLDTYVGLDAGQVFWSSGSTVLVGGVIGLRGALTKHISAELSAEFPIHAPSLLPKERYMYFKISVNG